MNIKFSHISTKNKVKCYNFDLEILDKYGDTMTLYFYTYKDLSGYSIEYGVNKPEHLILIGTAILINKEYIKNAIDSHSK
jgi:hypothetical protein